VRPAGPNPEGASTRALVLLDPSPRALRALAPPCRRERGDDLRIYIPPIPRYPVGVTKRLIDIDDDLLRKARETLGTGTMKDTVNRALAEVARAELRRRHTARLISGDGTDLGHDDIMAKAWR
jgi:Arc/MetJ family transcription regulator